MGEDVDILQIKANRFVSVVVGRTEEIDLVSRFRLDCCTEDGRKI